VWPPLRRGGFFLQADLDPAVPLDSVVVGAVGGHVVPVLVALAEVVEQSVVPVLVALAEVVEQSVVPILVALAAAVEQSVVPVPLVVVEEVVEPRQCTPTLCCRSSGCLLDGELLNGCGDGGRVESDRFAQLNVRN